VGAPPAPNGAVAAAPVATVTCILVLSPLRAADGHLRVQREVFPAGDPLDAYLPEGEALHHVTVNGATILPEHYARYVPQAGDEIWLWPSWGLSGSLLIGALVSLVVGLAISAASHFLFRPKPLLLPQQNQMSGEAERTFSFEGIRTAIGPGAVVPVVYGRHRIGGQLLLATVDQAAVILDDGATAHTATITNVTHGEPSAIVYVTAPGHGFVTGQIVLIQGVQGKTQVNTTWAIHVGDADSFILDSSWAVGFDSPYQGGGTATLYNQGSRTYQAITNPPTLTLMIGLCEGPIDAILTDTIQINGQPLANFPGVQVYTGLGTPSQPAFAEFGGARNTFADGRDIGESPLTYTSNAALHAFVLNLVWPEGLYFLNEKGEKQSNNVVLQYRFAPRGTGSWSEWAVFQVQADRTATVRLGVRREGLTYQAYDLQIQHLRAGNTDELRARYRSVLESVTEYVPDTYAYPYTAWLGLRALATDALRGSLPNVTVEVRGRQVRVGSLAVPETWSDNPAWCVLDALTNRRYGAGVSDSELDLTAFALYAAYCDQAIQGERRHTLNYVLDRETRAQQFFLETMGGSRGILLKTAGLWTPRPTRDETPTCLLSWTSVSNVRLTYIQDVDAINVLEARFASEEHDFEQDVITWPALAQWPPEVHKHSFDLRGVTKPSRIMRALQYELNRRRFENVLLEMDCSLEALPLQLHDLFRFAHPLPGWGTSGRIQQGSNAAILEVDEDCVFEQDITYVVYVRHEDDTLEAREVLTITLGPTRTLHLAAQLSVFPTPRTSTFVFGTLASNANTRTFRVTGLRRKNDLTVSLEALIHNPSIYDEAVASPLGVITTLFNPEGPPPPLLSLVATEVTRIQTSGASLRVINLSWDVAPLSSGYALYGGAMILRRVLLATGQMGQVEAGTIGAGAISDPNDPNYNYIPIIQVRGHVLDWDDYTAISGSTYQYRVVPISHLGVPNNAGAREVVIHIAGPTTPGYFPATPRNLRLQGQAVGVSIWEGRDLHVEWDSVADTPLFSETFFVAFYIVQVWAPGQLYLMRAYNAPLAPAGQSVQWTYTHQQNEEDQIRNGYAGARRDLQVMVWAVTNTGLLSLDPAVIVVTNPPPDMSNILPETQALFEAVRIDWKQWVRPRDFDHFLVLLDAGNPPTIPNQTVGIDFQVLLIPDLIAGLTYYVQIIPYDSFGIGLPSAIASVTPVALTADKLDNTPPAVPTGLRLTTGTDASADGTVMTWVMAHWNAQGEEDLNGYQLVFRVASPNIPTVVQPGRFDTSYKIFVPGNVTVFAKIASIDRLANLSAFTDPEVSITTGRDSTPPTAAANLHAIGAVQKIALLWTPPGDLDYDYSEVWTSGLNDRSTAGVIGQGSYSFEHTGFAPNQRAYYWIRPVDTSGNVGAFHPVSATAGVTAVAGQLDDTYISSLVATKILTGQLTALVSIGVADRVYIDGTNSLMVIRDQYLGNNRVLLGKLGPLSDQYGIQIFNNIGGLMFDANAEGVTAAGIKTGVINAGHLRTDTAVITGVAQIQDALIRNAHILDLSADKIIAGTINTQVLLGGPVAGTIAPIVLDGVNRQIILRDDNGTIRVWIGRIAAGPTDYSLLIYKADGTLMWSPETGAQTAGIAPAAVTTINIFNNAVTNSVSYTDIVGLSVTISETALSSLVFTLNAGDQVWVTLTATVGVATADDACELRIREDSAATGSPELAYGQTTGPGRSTMVCQGVYTAPSGFSGTKAFVGTFKSGGVAGNNVVADHIKMVGFRRQR
jgi:hypothetical protein